MCVQPRLIWPCVRAQHFFQSVRIWSVLIVPWGPRECGVMEMLTFKRCYFMYSCWLQNWFISTLVICCTSLRNFGDLLDPLTFCVQEHCMTMILKDFCILFYNISSVISPPLNLSVSIMCHTQNNLGTSCLIFFEITIWFCELQGNQALHEFHRCRVNFIYSMAQNRFQMPRKPLHIPLSLLIV